MDISEIVGDALKYYDTNFDKYNSVYKKIIYYKYIHNSHDTEHSVIVFYDTNKKELFRSRYEILGVYSKQHYTWIWPWSSPIYDRNKTAISRKLLNYGLDIPIKSSNYTDFQLISLKSEFITSRFRVTNELQLDIHVAIASYVTKIPSIFEIIVSVDDSEGEFVGKTKNIVHHIASKNSKDYMSVYLYLLDDKNITDK